MQLLALPHALHPSTHVRLTLQKYAPHPGLVPVHCAHDRPATDGAAGDGQCDVAHCAKCDTQSLSLAHILQPVTHCCVLRQKYEPQPRPVDVQLPQLSPLTVGLNCDGHTAGGAGHTEGTPMQSTGDAQYWQPSTQAPVERHIHLLHVPGPPLAVQL